VYDPFDAIMAAGQKLASQGATRDLNAPGTGAAVFGYNHADWYVDAVLDRAKRFQAAAANTAPGQDGGPVELVQGARAQLRPDGLAAAPSDAPAEIKRAIAAGNAISDRPYLEVHYPTHLNNPTYDCSSSTSHVLWGAGVFGTAPWVAAQFKHFGQPGPGRWITIYASDSHVFLYVAGLRFDTSHNGTDTGPNAGEDGPRWRLFDHVPNWDTWSVRHPAGL
jgi:hypothetical protein